MTQVKTYQTDHRIAKLIVCVLVIAVQLLGSAYEAGEAAMGLSTLIWFFGVNPVGYLVEALLGHHHGHSWV